MKRALTFARPFRKLLILSFISLIVVSIIGIIPPLIFRRIIDEAIPNKDFAQLNMLFVAAVVLALISTGVNLYNRYLSSSIGEGLIFNLRVALFDHLQQMPLTFFTRAQTGALLSRLNSDVVGAQQTVSQATEIASDLLILSTTLITMLILSWQITLLALLVLPVFILLDRRVGRQLASISRERMKVDADMSTTMAERFNVGGAMLVKLFGSRRHEIAEFSDKADAVKHWGIRQAVTGRVYYGSLALIASLGAALVYWWGGHQVIHGAIALGTLVAMAAYVQRLYAPLTSLATARTDVLVALVSFERVFEVLDTPILITDKPDARKLSNPTGRIEFDHVWFRHGEMTTTRIASLEQLTHTHDIGTIVEENLDPTRWILQDVNFIVEPGQLVALVGPSGAGKTTLSSLIPRLFDVEQGAIRIDGNDVRDLTLASLRQSIGVVTQDAHMFHDTVRSNLLYAQPLATDDEMIAAAKAAQIHEVISALPNGYDTVVGERGYRLSGGEKQRMAIARVLLKHPAIIILDEATAHLDSETEAQVQHALNNALESRTALVIAHRLSTVRNADKIVVLDEGRIVQSGTHEALLATDGLYKELYETQFRLEESR